jgi:hypothetical protein
MTGAELSPYLVPVLLTAQLAQWAFFGRRIVQTVGTHGKRLTMLERLHLRHKPQDFDSFKIGGSD